MFIEGSVRLHHVGIVQPNEGAAAEMMERLGLVEAYRGYVPQFQALCIFTEPNGGSPIEFVVPDGGSLVTFNKGAGGVHHIALEVEDLLKTSAQLRANGMALVEETPVKGAGEFLCNFLRPSATRGVITELVQLI